VSRAWCCLLSDPSLWTRLDATPFAAHPAKLLGAAARAQGALEQLRVAGSMSHTWLPLLSVAQDNAAISQLHVAAGLENFLFVPQAEALLDALPRLRHLEAGVYCNAAAALAALATPRLRLHSLQVDDFDDAPAARAASLGALAGAVAAHASLRHLALEATLDGVSLTALCGAALSLRSLELLHCSLAGPMLASLAGLLEAGRLHSLTIDNGDAPIAQERGHLERFARALAGSGIIHLALPRCSLWAQRPQGHHALWSPGELLCAALTRHASLTRLSLPDNQARTPRERAAAGAALAALASASPSALAALDVSASNLRDVGLAPLLDALRGHCGLRELRCDANGIVSAFAGERVAPAVQASRLERFSLSDENGNSFVELRAAERACAARAAQRG